MQHCIRLEEYENRYSEQATGHSGFNVKVNLVISIPLLSTCCLKLTVFQLSHMPSASDKRSAKIIVSKLQQRMAPQPLHLKGWW